MSEFSLPKSFNDQPWVESLPDEKREEYYAHRLQSINRAAETIARNLSENPAFESVAPTDLSETALWCAKRERAAYEYAMQVIFNAQHPEAAKKEKSLDEALKDID